jgi:hypothetical protein
VKPLSSQPTLPLGAAATWLARCTDAEHPTLDGRVRVTFDGAGEEPLELWVPKLAGLAIREGDRVLVTQPANGSEPVAVGVLDGFAQRPKREWRDKAVLALEPDEQIVVESRSGDALLALRDTEEGPVVALLGPDVAVEIDGELKLTAKAISLAARQGEARVEATSDVVIRGETIQLN